MISSFLSKTEIILPMNKSASPTDTTMLNTEVEVPAAAVAAEQEVSQEVSQEISQETSQETLQEPSESKEDTASISMTPASIAPASITVIAVDNDKEDSSTGISMSVPVSVSKDAKMMVNADEDEIFADAEQEEVKDADRDVAADAKAVVDVKMETETEAFKADAKDTTATTTATTATTTSKTEHDAENDHDHKTTMKEEAPAVTSTKTPTKAAEPEDDRPAIWEPNEFDVLSGRGASVNAHGGNKKFRALCFVRKPEFEAGNHAAKRRIATEIVASTLVVGGTVGTGRFLKKKVDKGPWLEMTREQAILKACQVMRDYKRPDRLAIREMMAQNGQARKRSRQQESTPLLDTPIPTGPLEPIIENPFGVHDHDILSGRGAFVNGHIGNNRLRILAQERKIQFDSGNYTEKRALATEIVQIIKALEPPGRFLKRVKGAPKEGDEEQPSMTIINIHNVIQQQEEPVKIQNETGEWVLPPKGLDGTWQELSDEKAIHKACQVMRDIDRPDRKDRELRRAKKKHKTVDGKSVDNKEGDDDVDDVGDVAADEGKTTEGDESKEETTTTATTTNNDTKPKDNMTVLAETTAEKAAVDEAVAATEEALDKALDAAGETSAAAKATINNDKEAVLIEAKKTVEV